MFQRRVAKRLMPYSSRQLQPGQIEQINIGKAKRKLRQDVGSRLGFWDPVGMGIQLCHDLVGSEVCGATDVASSLLTFDTSGQRSARTHANTRMGQSLNRKDIMEV